MHKTVLAGVVAMWAVFAQAATVQVQALGSITNLTPGSGFNIQLADGITNVAAGSLVRIGYFSGLTSSDVSTLFADWKSASNPNGLSTLYNSWENFGNVGTMDHTLNFAGRFTPRAWTNTPVGAFNGRQVYVWIWNAATTNAATQFGVFTATNWTFPTTDNPGDLGNFARNYAFNTNFNLGTNNGALGIAAIIGSEDGNSFNLARLEQVPEPGSVVALLAVGSLLPRRRRKG
jgi:hypothetical protein